MMEDARAKSVGEQSLSEENALLKEKVRSSIL